MTLEENDYSLGFSNPVEENKQLLVLLRKIEKLAMRHCETENDLAFIVQSIRQLIYDLKEKA